MKDLGSCFIGVLVTLSRQVYNLCLWYPAKYPEYFSRQEVLSMLTFCLFYSNQENLLYM